jgi:hypothetical protein
MRKDIITPNGYIKKHRPDHHFADCHGNVMEHRLFYEEYHKCCLLPSAQIHHENGVKTDNRIENLDLKDPYTHNSLHHRGKRHKHGHPLSTRIKMSLSAKGRKAGPLPNLKGWETRRKVLAGLVVN